MAIQIPNLNLIRPRSAELAATKLQWVADQYSVMIVYVSTTGHKQEALVLVGVVPLPTVFMLLK